MENTKLKDRIKEVRKDHKKSQAAFGADLGCSRDAIANYEGGRAEPPETFLQLLCSKFGINDKWLRTGEGPKEAGDDEELWKKIRERFRLHGLPEAIARAWFSLPEDERERLADEACKFASRVRDEMPADDARHAAIERRRAEDLARVNAEYDLEEKGSSSTSETTSDAIAEKKA